MRSHPTGTRTVQLILLQVPRLPRTPPSHALFKPAQASSNVLNLAPPKELILIDTTDPRINYSPLKVTPHFPLKKNARRTGPNDSRHPTCPTSRPLGPYTHHSPKPCPPPPTRKSVPARSVNSPACSLTARPRPRTSPNGGYASAEPVVEAV